MQFFGKTKCFSIIKKKMPTIEKGWRRHCNIAITQNATGDNIVSRVLLSPITLLLRIIYILPQTSSQKHWGIVYSS